MGVGAAAIGCAFFCRLLEALLSRSTNAEKPARIAVWRRGSRLAALPADGSEQAAILPRPRHPQFTCGRAKL